MKSKMEYMPTYIPSEIDLRGALMFGTELDFSERECT
jgi:hypothetical protein